MEGVSIAGWFVTCNFAQKRISADGRPFIFISVPYSGEKNWAMAERLPPEIWSHIFSFIPYRWPDVSFDSQDEILSYLLGRCGSIICPFLCIRLTCRLFNTLGAVSFDPFKRGERPACAFLQRATLDQIVNTIGDRQISISGPMMLFALKNSSEDVALILLQMHALQGDDDQYKTVIADCAFDEGKRTALNLLESRGFRLSPEKRIWQKIWNTSEKVAGQVAIHGMTALQNLDLLSIRDSVLQDASEEEISYLMSAMLPSLGRAVVPGPEWLPPGVPRHL